VDDITINEVTYRRDTDWRRWEYQDDLGRWQYAWQEEAFLDEIERLRDELLTLQTWRNADIDAFHGQVVEIMHLREKIDAYAAARRGLTLACTRDARGTWSAWVAAEDALLTAATPQEDDRAE
jgi:hypothetical protein